MTYKKSIKWTGASVSSLQSERVHPKVMTYNKSIEWTSSFQRDKSNLFSPIKGQVYTIQMTCIHRSP